MQPVFIDIYGTDNDPPLPCQMHWDDYAVRIEQIGSFDDAARRQQRLTVSDA